MGLKHTVFWFRRDLRLFDNHGLWQALTQSNNVLPIFIFDSNILEHLPKNDARVVFIFNTLSLINKSLKQKFNLEISIYHGAPLEIIQNICATIQVEKVICNSDFEPYGINRDQQIKKYLSEQGLAFKSYNDHIIHSPTEILKSDNTPYIVYTPYSKIWIRSYDSVKDNYYPSEELLDHFCKKQNHSNPNLKSLGFQATNQLIENYSLSNNFINQYHCNRDFPNLDSTSKLGPHLRFGTVSVRQIAKKALLSEDKTFLKALIWRDFFIQIMFHFPQSLIKSFKPKYDAIKWRNNTTEFDFWCQGKTGYPLVDAGMRELNKTGYMHNRVRMVTASFLCKHLLIDWRWGEAYFAEKLNDFELASNVGNWQWVAGTGVDAAPYFRIFNPATQLEKFDKQQEYVSKWVSEINTSLYPEPIVDHKEARLRCLATYKMALS